MKIKKKKSQTRKMKRLKKWEINNKTDRKITRDRYKKEELIKPSQLYKRNDYWNLIYFIYYIYINSFLQITKSYHLLHQTSQLFVRELHDQKTSWIPIYFMMYILLSHECWWFWNLCWWHVHPQMKIHLNLSLRRIYLLKIFL